MHMHIPGSYNNAGLWRYAPPPASPYRFAGWLSGSSGLEPGDYHSIR